MLRRNPRPRTRQPPPQLPGSPFSTPPAVQEALWFTGVDDPFAVNFCAANFAVTNELVDGGSREIHDFAKFAHSHWFAGSGTTAAAVVW